MPRAYNLIRELPAYRADAFRAGLAAAGFEVHGMPREAPRRDDVLVMWNRYGHYDTLARRFEAVGARVLVAENGYLGREWNGARWYALALGFHNGRGAWPEGPADRWDGLGVRLAPWRQHGSEIVVLATRHIGLPGVAEPGGWAAQMARYLSTVQPLPVRIRPHPGESSPAVPLGDDLTDAWAVATWGSGAAVKALLMGVPVLYGFPQWIAAGAARHVSRGLPVGRFLGDRLPAFRRLAWAMWTVEEITRGEPFRWLLR